MKNARILVCLWVAISIALFSVNAVAQNRKPIDVEKARVIKHWTKERRVNAIPRDLVIDARGLGYLKQPDGTLRPHGHSIPARITPTNHSILPFRRPGGGGSGSGDKTPPTITNMDPATGTTIGESYTFEARVTDASGVKSVTFKIQKIGSTYVNSFPAGRSFGGVWGANFHGFTDGDWQWWVEAKDRAGNTGTSETVNFKVHTGAASVPITNAVWPLGGNNGGIVQTAVGRLYFEMPDNQNRSKWSGYLCSASVANDAGTTGRSVIITAAHCVYDDVNKAFARNVLFIPNQAGTTVSGTDLDCSNDPMGCWVPSFGVVDKDWAIRTFPENMAWDYAFYVVPDSGAHLQNPESPDVPDALDTAARSLPLSFATPNFAYTYALGYSWNDDPKLMYCSEDMELETNSGYNADWWLPNCGLTAGSSGGPWVQPMDEAIGSGFIISVNSWGYVWNGIELPGMAGAKLDGRSSAFCVFDATIKADQPSTSGDGEAGVSVSCP